MSWDVMIFHLREKPESLEDMSDAEMLPLGLPAQVRSAISAVLAEVDWSDRNWGRYRVDGFSIEFSVGEEDPVEGMMLHVRGGGDAISDIMKSERTNAEPNSAHRREVEWLKCANRTGVKTHNESMRRDVVRSSFCSSNETD